MRTRTTSHRSEQNFFSKNTGQENFGSTIGTFDGEPAQPMKKLQNTSTNKFNVFDNNYLKTSHSFNPQHQTTRANLFSDKSSRGNAWLSAPKPDESKKLKNLNPLLIRDDNNTSHIIDHRLTLHSSLTAQHQTNKHLSSKTQPRFFTKPKGTNTTRPDYISNLLTSSQIDQNQNFRTTNPKNLAMSTNSTHRMTSYDDDRPLADPIIVDDFMMRGQREPLNCKIFWVERNVGLEFVGSCSFSRIA